MARPPLRRPNSSSHPLCGGCLTRICPAGGLEYRFSGVGRPPGAVRFDPRMSVQLRRNRLCLTGPISVPRNHTSHNAARGGADHPEHCRWPIATGRPVVAPHRAPDRKVAGRQPSQSPGNGPARGVVQRGINWRCGPLARHLAQPYLAPLLDRIAAVSGSELTNACV